MPLSDALTSDRVLLMDGALGTELLRAGLALGDCAAAWNLTRPADVARVHTEYLSVGAEVLLTNTFLSDPISLARHGLGEQLERINFAGVNLARRAPGPSRFVLGDIGPIFTPGRNDEFADRDALQQTVLSLADADGLLFETCSSPAALTAIEFIFHRVSDLPLLLSLTYHHKDGDLLTISGHRPEVYARHAARHGVTALGVNCGKDIGIADVCEIIRRYRNETDLPLFARPNAGTPMDGVYPLVPEALTPLATCGAAMLGGCCGTTPVHIAALRLIAARLASVVTTPSVRPAPGRVG